MSDGAGALGLFKDVFLKQDQIVTFDSDQSNDFLIVYKGQVQYYELGKSIADLAKKVVK